MSFFDEQENIIKRVAGGPLGLGKAVLGGAAGATASALGSAAGGSSISSDRPFSREAQTQNKNMEEKRIKKDIDKLSKVSGFIDNELKLYDEETILDKKNTIIIMYNHGSWKPETRREECIKGAGRIPEAVGVEPERAGPRH